MKKTSYTWDLTKTNKDCPYRYSYCGNINCPIDAYCEKSRGGKKPEVKEI